MIETGKTINAPPHEGIWRRIKTVAGKEFDLFSSQIEMMEPSEYGRTTHLIPTYYNLYILSTNNEDEIRWKPGV